MGRSKQQSENNQTNHICIHSTNAWFLCRNWENLSTSQDRTKIPTKQIQGLYTPTLKNDGIFHLSKQVADILWMATVACSSHNFIKVDYNCRFPSLRIGDSKWKKHCSIMNQSLFLNKLKTYIMADKCSQERIISLATVISIYPKV